MFDMPGLLLFSLIMMRMSGFILLNPIFGRRNIPNIVKAGFIMVLSLNLFAFASGMGVNMEIANSFDYAILMLKEFAIGYVVGFVMNLFLYIASFAGGIIDFNVGLSMASVYDPQNNASMPLTGTILNAMFILLFFVADGHLAVMKILMYSEEVIPYGQVVFSTGAVNAVLDIFKECTLLGLKLAFPILAIELIGEVGVGILMKVIPQINVFVVNVQTKLLLGNFILLLMCIPIGNFFSDVIDIMVNTIVQILRLL